MPARSAISLRGSASSPQSVRPREVGVATTSVSFEAGVAGS
jgi:hypothetical protein